MNKKFARLIQPNSKSVLQFIGEDLDVNENFGVKENFLLINPNCKYTITNKSDFKSNKVDTILISSSAIGNLSIKKIISFINKAAKNLKDDGMIIFILENMSYAENIKAILNGEPLPFKVTLTFDDLKTAIDNSDVSGLKMMQIFNDVTIDRSIAEISKVKLNVSHFVICAVKKSFASSIKNTLIQSYLGEVLVCASIRVTEPNRFISTIPGIVIQSKKSGEQMILSNDPKYAKKIFINQRVSMNTLEQGLNMFDSIVKNNYLLIEEIDDNPILWRQKYEETKFINFVGVHGVQTSTKSLAEFFKQFNPNVKVFENQLTELPAERNFKDEIARHEPLIIFFGALNRDKDFYEILPAINKIAAEYGDNILFKVIAKTELFNTIETPNKIFLGKREIYNGQYVPYDVYTRELHTSHISLLPLRNNIFNRSKSDLKFIECAGNGSVVIASPTVYSEAVKDGETGFIYHDVNEFYNTLKMLIDNQNKRIEVAKNAYEYVKHNRLLSQHYEERFDWYNELIAKLPELNIETQKRIEILKEKGYEVFGGFGEVTEKIDVFDN